VTLRSVIYAATQRGWIYKSPYEEVVSDFIQSFDIKQKSNLDLPDNNFGRLVRWFLNTAPYPYPNFAIAAAFACYSACAQGTYRTPTNRNLNLYQLLINAASSGKEHYIVNTKRILNAIKCPSLGDEPQSSQGLRRELFEYSSRISIVDEALIPLNGWAKSPNIGQAILRDILQLWSADCLNGMRTKDTLMPQVQNISYSLFGTGTTTHLRNLLNSPMFVELGLLSRLMIFRGDIPEKLTHNFSKKTELPDQTLLNELTEICKKTCTELIEAPASGKKFKNKSGEEFEEKALMGISVKPSISVAFSKEAEARWYSYREKMHELNLKEQRDVQESGAGVV
jgi:hypothetical protein